MRVNLTITDGNNVTEINGVEEIYFNHYGMIIDTEHASSVFPIKEGTQIIRFTEGEDGREKDVCKDDSII